MAGEGSGEGKYFYPEADTPGCITQSCDLRDHRQDHAVAEAWGTWDEKDQRRPDLRPDHPSSFLVDVEGRIERAWYGVAPKDTVPNALAAIRT